jgi:hypothetical protein
MADEKKTQRSCRIPLDERLADREKVPRAGAPAFPIPLWAYVDELVERANRVGASTNRVELIAAWLIVSTPSANTMKRWVETYRGVPVRQVVLGSSAEAKSRIFTPRQAGRPPAG